MFAAAKKVDNLISTIDYNGRQIDGDTDDVLSLGDLNAKLRAFGWEVLEEKRQRFRSSNCSFRTCKI